MAGVASLIVTLYTPGKEQGLIQALQDRILERLSLAPKGDDRWSDEANEAILLRFVPADDTTVLQLALNAGGDAARAWENLRTKLKSVLDAEVMNGIWGYTLTYQAVLNADVSEDHAFEKLRPHARPLNTDKELYTLAQAGMGGGRIWLLAIPTEGTGPAAATVYVALSDKNETSVKTFYGEDARLLMPELIAHKGYYEKHRYRGNNLDLYKKDLKAFRETIRRSLEDVRQGPVKSDELNALTLGYDNLVEKVWDLESLRVSMARHLYNYNESPDATSNDILNYHRRQIEMANSELELLVAEGQYALILQL